MTASLSTTAIRFRQRLAPLFMLFNDTKWTALFRGAMFLVALMLFTSSDIPLYFLPLFLLPLSLSLCLSLFLSVAASVVLMSSTPSLLSSTGLITVKPVGNILINGWRWHSYSLCIHTHTQPWERLHQGRVQNKNLSVDYFRQNKSQHSDTHSNVRARKIVIQ